MVDQISSTITPSQIHQYISEAIESNDRIDNSTMLTPLTEELELAVVT